MKQSYLELIALIERVHRQFLERVRAELDGRGIEDINNVQALILFNLGESELTVGELTLRGCYLGSNVSYNVKKMVENGYLTQERSPHDRRLVRVRLTKKGLDLRSLLDAMHDRDVAMLGGLPLESAGIRSLTEKLTRLDRFWTEIVERGSRSLPRLGGYSGQPGDPAALRANYL